MRDSTPGRPYFSAEQRRERRHLVGQVSGGSVRILVAGDMDDGELAAGAEKIRAAALRVSSPALRLSRSAAVALRGRPALPRGRPPVVAAARFASAVSAAVGAEIVGAEIVGARACCP